MCKVRSSDVKYFRSKVSSPSCRLHSATKWECVQHLLGLFLLSCDQNTSQLGHCLIRILSSSIICNFRNCNQNIGFLPCKWKFQNKIQLGEQNCGRRVFQNLFLLSLAFISADGAYEAFQTQEEFLFIFFPKRNLLRFAKIRSHVLYVSLYR